MKSLLLALILLGVSQQSLSVLFPVLTNPRITRCIAGSIPGQPVLQCSGDVFYAADGAALVDIVPIDRPNRFNGTTLRAYTVHCQSGTTHPSDPRRPFGGCVFRAGDFHSPVLSNCRLVSVWEWDLTPDSTCGVTTTWGPHSGAGPGGECVLFVQSTADIVTGTLHTIYGIVTAEQMANSGNLFCQKPLPPSVTCDVLLPATIDHGTVGPDSSSSISVSGQVSCGDNPRIGILGGGRLNLAPGVTTVLTARSIGPDQIQITSDLVTQGGAIGDHSASTVIIVSPY